MKSYRGTSAQCGWCPYEKRRSGHRHTQRDSHVRTWRGDGHLHAKERGPWRHWPCLDFQPPDWETICCLSHPLHGLLFKPPTAWSSIMETQADLDHGGGSFYGRCSSGHPQTPAILRPLHPQDWSLTPQLLSVNDGDEPSPALSPLGACPQPKGAASPKATVLS